MHDEVVARLALAESEAHYQLLAEHASDIVVRMDPDRRISWVSPAVTPLLGWSPSELIGKPGVDLIHPADVGGPAAPSRPYLRRRPPVARRRAPCSCACCSSRAAIAGCRPGSRCSPTRAASSPPSSTVSPTWKTSSGRRSRPSATSERLRRTIDTLHDPHVLLEAVRDADGAISRHGVRRGQRGGVQRTTR